jgi:PIN domain nuclease of toxin-antitoxin system
VKLLLDTHIALWAVADDANLSKLARELILAAQNEIFFSAVSTWEIATKRSIGGDIPCTASQAEEDFLASGYRPLSVTPQHTIAVEKLPLLHKDPFDRLLIAQALSEPMYLVTHDEKIGQYNLPFVRLV